jgi:hypothetical protein
MLDTLTQFKVNCIYDNIVERNSIYKSKRFYKFIRNSITSRIPLLNKKLLKKFMREIFKKEDVLKLFFTKYILEDYLPNLHFDVELKDLINL